MPKIKVLIVDDSALVRQVLTEILNQDPDLEVIGSAQDPLIARNKIKELNPDVLTLDVEMPRMDGLTFLNNLMRLRPMPVLMVSSLTEKGADITLRALELGAVDYIEKPKLDVKKGLTEYAEELCSKVKQAAKSRVRANPSPLALATTERHSADAILEKGSSRHFKTTENIIAIGASTGGTEAIKEVLIKLPADTPGIVITQHIPAAFSRPFAMRMDSCSHMTVYEASDGQYILPGHVYIAPGSHHLLVERDGARYLCRLSDGPPVNRHRPAVDVMFRSVAKNVGPNAMGIILTGMGNDGAAGLLEMKEAGASTIAQDEKSSVVWGMPGESVKMNAVDKILALDKIHNEINMLNNCPGRA